MNKTYANWILVAILALALLLRWPSLSNDIGTDEGKYVLGIDYPGSGVISDVLYSIHLLTGASAAALRFLTVLTALATVFIIYKIGTIFGDKLGLAMAFAAATLPSHAIMSKTLFLDVYVVMFLSLSAYIFFLLEKRPQSLCLHVAFFLSSLVLSLIKPQAALLLAPFFIYGLLKHKTAVMSKPEYWSLIFAVIVFIANYLANPHRFGDLVQYFGSSHNLSLRGTILSKIMLSLEYFWNTDALFWITGIAGLAMAVKQRKKPLFFIIMLSTTLLLYIVVLLPTYYYLVYFAVPLAFGTGYLLLSIKRRAVAMAALIIMLLFAASRSLPSGLQSPMHDQHADKQELLFSKHRQEINAFFSDQPVVLVGGDFGHQYQFYIDKPIIRSCGLENFRATKALVTNLPDTRCAGETAAIERDWIEEVMITGKSENITLYSLKGNKAFINGPS